MTIIGIFLGGNMSPNKMIVLMTFCDDNIRGEIKIEAVKSYLMSDERKHLAPFPPFPLTLL